MASARVDVARTIETIRSKYSLVALGCAFIVDGKLLAAHAAGERKAGSGIPVTSGDRWDLASCTKAMTAVMIARLIESGSLSWITTLDEGFGATIPIREEYRTVTLAELLQHRSGVHPCTGPAWVPPLRDAVAAALASSDDPREQRAAVAKLLLQAPPHLPRGSHCYSNGGYLLAGLLAERMMNSSWEEQMSREVFLPLGMIDAGFGPPVRGHAVDQPWPHGGDGAEPVPVEPGDPAASCHPAFRPSGGVTCTLQDRSRFVCASLAGEGGSAEYLSADSLRRLHYPVAETEPGIRWPPDSAPYAMGWEIFSDGSSGGSGWMHAGSNGKNLSSAWVVPATGDAVLLACNQRGGQVVEAFRETGKTLIAAVR